MMLKDQNDLNITASDPKYVALYDDAITELAHFRDPSNIIEGLLEQSPHFAMAHILSAYLYLLSTDENDAAAAKQHLALANAAAQDSAINEREQKHLEALSVWLDGNMEKASFILDSLLIDYPQDMLALLIGHQLDFFLGHAQNLKNRIARSLPSWDKSHPLYSFVLGMYGFGLEEAREYNRAEDIAKQAVALNPKDVWGIHAVAHALEMLNRYEEGAKYMKQRKQDWGENNFFIPHNALHLGLFELEMGDVKEILALSDTMIHNASTGENPIVLLDGSSLIWRFYLDNVDVGKVRLQALASSWRKIADQNFYSFNDVHAVMAFVAADDFSSAEKVIQSQKTFLKNNKPGISYYHMTKEIGLPISEALYAFGKGNYQECINKLMPIKNTIHHFGGSHAQRDVFARTLVEAAFRSKNKLLAQALLSERLEEKPQSPYNLMKKENLALMA
ncbi:tetratricopeptide repeat protein [Dasania marina]|uniref:tetratricopeptide repeat protein n=1 Tax=Dasania marina TaxID=471499 RepID=UPI0003747CAB|nr:tetratricopeptide repeat protein [Dasania marina]